MAAYMKTDMPFYGIQKPDRIPIYREMKMSFQPQTQKEYEKAVLSLWSLPHREEKYAAIEYAKQNEKFLTPASIDLYRTLLVQGAWWDFVDDIAITLVGHTYLAHRSEIKSITNQWIDDDDLWLRRTALICHNHHKKETDQKQLFSHCLKRSHEKEFFIRKAIGWALREYSYQEPHAVLDFITVNRQQLSPLSYNEAAKNLVRKGTLKSDKNNA